jgi:hypothetical protein
LLDPKKRNANYPKTFPLEGLEKSYKSEPRLYEGLQLLARRLRGSESYRSFVKTELKAQSLTVWALGARLQETQLEYSPTASQGLSSDSKMRIEKFL